MTTVFPPLKILSLSFILIIPFILPSLSYSEPETSTSGVEVSPVKEGTPEEEERLEQIYQRNLELKQEREKLIRDREQLHEDIKNTGLVRTKEQFDKIIKRITDLEEKIKQFNEEAKKLNEEEKKIRDEIKNRQTKGLLKNNFTFSHLIFGSPLYCKAQRAESRA